MLIVGVWLIGGLIAIAGAFVYAELAARRPEVGGQYAYLRDAWGPMPAFLYGWSLLLVIQSGGMAAVAITFARYFLELTHLPLPDGAVAAGALALLTAINCLGVRAGSNVQSVLMVLKIVAIAALVLCGLLLRRPQPGRARRGPRRRARHARRDRRGADPGDVRLWRLADGELRRRRDARSAPRPGARPAVRRDRRGPALHRRRLHLRLCARARRASPKRARPATAVMRLALGETGATLIALGIAISALGFLSQGMLTTPRVYFAMAEDRLFFRSVAKVSARTHVPVVAILLQGAAAIAIALSGTYRPDPVLCRLGRFHLVRPDRRGLVRLPPPRRGKADGSGRPAIRCTTGLFVAACAVIVAATVCNNPVNSAVGFAILLAGVPACLYWQRKRRGAHEGDRSPNICTGRRPGARCATISARARCRISGWTAGRSTLAELELDGASHYRYPPLREAIAAQEAASRPSGW